MYSLSTTGVPNGIAVQFSQPTITLGPSGGGSNVSYSTTLTLTPGATFNTPFSFNLIATPQDAPEFPVSAPGSLLARPESINVDQVTATPQFGNAGTLVTVSARVFAVVNESVSAQLQLTITNASGGGAGLFFSNVFTLSPSSTVQTITFNPIDTTNFTNGAYTLSVQAEFANVPQGAAATGALLIGSPLSGVLTASPSVVPPGSSTVQATLTISRDTAQNPVSTLIGTVLVNGVPRTMTLYTNGAQKLAYICSDSQVNIVDVTTPSSPVLLSSFANSLLTESGAVTGFTGVSCGIYNADLIVNYSREEGNISTDPAAVQTHFAIFSLANPLNPTQLGSVTNIERPDSAGGLYLVGSSALLIQNDVFYNQFSNFIFQQNGDVWALDLTNANTGSVAFQSDLYPCGGINSTTNACNNGVTISGTFVPNDQYRGGPYAMHPGTEVNSTTAYFASSSSSGGNIEEPGIPAFDGQLLVVDDTNPAALNILTKVDVPQSAYLTDVAVQGNIALAVGDSTGVYDINSGYIGTLVIASFDIANPHSPVLLNTVVTALTDKPGATVVPLGNNTFAVGGTSNNGMGSLVLVDASNPNALRYVPYNALFVASPEIANPPYFYTLSGTPSAATNQLSIFQLSTITGPQLSVSLQIPTTGAASLVTGSFNQTPSSSTPGAGFTTYVWNQPSLNTITFNMNLNGVNPGDVTTLVNGGALNYTLPTLGSGTLPLGGLSVLTQHILSISPVSQSVNYGGQSGNYTATITNPTNASQTFNLSAIIPPGWTSVVQPSIVVAALSSQNFNVAVTPPANVQASVVTFNVAANSTGGISDSVPAQITVNYGGANLGGNAGTAFINFTASVSPGQITAGQSVNSQPFTFTITNTGNETTAFQLGYPTTIPSNWSVGSYTPAYYATIQPNGTALITETLFVPVGTAPGAYQVAIPVQGGSITQSLSITVNVSGAGVGGYISPNSGPPNSGFLVNLTNTGMTQDTFNLSVVGAFAQAASIQPTVTLASLAQMSIPIAFTAPNYLVQSNTPLQIRAVSQNNSNVQDLMSATVTVPAAKSVSSSILPSATTVSLTPATANLLFEAANTGNVGDSYSAQITGVTGPVTASLVNTNGQSGQSISAFYITALGTAQFPLNANVTGTGQSTVTVAVTSLTAPSVTASSTVIINGAESMSANAGTTPQSAAINTAFGHALAVTVTEGGSNPVAGVDVTFTAPASGASGTFSNSMAAITVATNAAGVASAAFMANGTAGGPYLVTAAAPGLSTVTFSLTNTAGSPSLQFYPIAPCRLVDTRGAAAGFDGIAPFSGPSIPAGGTLTIPVQSAIEAGANTTPAPCGTIPSSAQAYSFNLTVVPHDEGAVDYVSLWPAGLPQPFVSTLDDPEGLIVANAAIVPAGSPSGGVSVYNPGPAAADVVIDMNGYFAPPATALQFYPVAPCRLVDTRGLVAGFNGIAPFSGPSIAAGGTLTIPVLSATEAGAVTAPAPCGVIPTTAQAYSFNLTVVPADEGAVDYVSLWPAGSTKPFVSTLDDPEGLIVANAAIVPAGAPTGGVSVFNPGPSSADVVIDMNGYFAPPATSLQFFPVAPCRLVDTRGLAAGFNGIAPFSGPSIAAGGTLTIPVQSAAEASANTAPAPCGVIPSTAQAYSINITVVPRAGGPVDYVSLWPAGLTQPFVSTLDDPEGLIVANAAIVPAGSPSGGMSVFNAGPSAADVVIDMNGYFATPAN